jgi:hypothetical protein
MFENSASPSKELMTSHLQRHEGLWGFAARHPMQARLRRHHVGDVTADVVLGAATEQTAVRLVDQDHTSLGVDGDEAVGHVVEDASKEVGLVLVGTEPLGEGHGPESVSYARRRNETEGTPMATHQPAS